MKMNYNLILVDSLVIENRMTIHRMNVITGDYLTPVNLGGDLFDRILGLIEVIKRDKPDKIIFDRFGFGELFYETFMREVNNRKDVPFDIDAFGLIIYE